MKHISLMLVFLSLTVAGFSQNKAPGFVKFIGTTDTMYNGNQVILYNRATNDNDSAKVVDGHFEFKVVYKEPTRYMFYSKFEAKKKGGYAPWGILVGGPGEIKMQADLETFANTKVTGAPDNALYAEYAAASAAASKAINDKLTEKYGQEFMSKPDRKDPKYKQLVADYEAMSEASMPAEKARIETFVAKHPGSLASIYVLSGAVTTLGATKSEELFRKLAPTYKETSYGKRIVSVVESAKLTAIGQTAPDFEQADTSGNMVKLSALRGKYILVDFWASWCGPCRQENPNLVKAYAQYKDKGFSVLGVSLDQPGKRQAWIEAIHKDNLTWTHVSDLKYWDNAVAKQYGVQFIPQNFLLDPKGKIVAANITGEALNKKLAELFKTQNQL